MAENKQQASETESRPHAPDGFETINTERLRSEEAVLATLDKLFNVGQPGVVFSEPVTTGDVTVITAAEVYVAMGVGFGGGYGGVRGTEGEGGGGGGGGVSAGRPTAAIIVDAHGVRVEPVVDVTKIALAFFTMIGAIFIAWRRMARRR